jgi:hypothetical protein
MKFDGKRMLKKGMNYQYKDKSIFMIQTELSFKYY